MSELTTKAEVRQPTNDVPPLPMPGPLSPDQLISTLIMFVIAAAGGFISFYRKFKEGNVRAFNVTELIGELVVSGICGVFAYWLFQGFGLNPYLVAAGVGIVGHMGSRFLFLGEKMMTDVADRYTGGKPAVGTGPMGITGRTGVAGPEGQRGPAGPAGPAGPSS